MVVNERVMGELPVVLLAAVGSMISHSGPIGIALSVTHVAAGQIKAWVENGRKGLAHVLATAPQLPSLQRSKALVRYSVGGIFAAFAKNRPKTTALPALAKGRALGNSG